MAQNQLGPLLREHGVPLVADDVVARHLEVAPGAPVRLTWDNGQGLVFALDIKIDEFFMFDVKQSVENKSDKPVTLFPWSLVVRYGTPPAEGIL